MEESVIYGLLNGKFVDYREELEKEENFLSQNVKKDNEKFVKTLNEEQLDILKHYEHSKLLLEENIDYQVGIRILNYGIKIGIQLQKSLHDLYNYFDEPDYYE